MKESTARRVRWWVGFAATGSLVVGVACLLTATAMGLLGALRWLWAVNWLGCAIFVVGLVLAALGLGTLGFCAPPKMVGPDPITRETVNKVLGRRG